MRYNRRLWLVCLLLALLVGVPSGLPSLSVSAQTLGSWMPTTSFPDSVVSPRCVAIDTYVFCLGNSTDFYYAELSSSGVSTWSATTAYPANVTGQSCVTTSPFVGSTTLGLIACIGGANSTGATNAVYYALLTAGGIGKWNKTTSYPTSIYDQSCAFAGVYVYCVGGLTSPGKSTNGVYYADFNMAGIGPWMNATVYPTTIFDQSCVTSLQSPSGVIAYFYIYCVAGGISPTGSPSGNSATYFAQLETGAGDTQASVVDWSPTTNYPTGALGESCVATSSYIYCVGGSPGSSTGNAVFYAPLSSSGVGTWSTASSYPNGIQSPTCVTWSSYVYCVGGTTGVYPSPVTNVVYYAEISVPGTTTVTSTTTTTATATSATTTTQTVTATSTTAAPTTVTSITTQTTAAPTTLTSTSTVTRTVTIPTTAVSTSVSTTTLTSTATQTTTSTTTQTTSTVPGWAYGSMGILLIVGLVAGYVIKRRPAAKASEPFGRLASA